LARNEIRRRVTNAKISAYRAHARIIEVAKQGVAIKCCVDVRNYDDLTDCGTDR
jgi:hypothetical protein